MKYGILIFLLALLSCNQSDTNSHAVIKNTNSSEECDDKNTLRPTIYVKTSFLKQFNDITNLEIDSTYRMDSFFEKNKYYDNLNDIYFNYIKNRDTIVLFKTKGKEKWISKIALHDTSTDLFQKFQKIITNNEIEYNSCEIVELSDEEEYTKLTFNTNKQRKITSIILDNVIE